MRELFNAAFVSCWNELPEQFQDELVHAIETALMSPNIPPELLHQLLDLAEFMEVDARTEIPYCRSMTERSRRAEKPDTQRQLQ